MKSSTLVRRFLPYYRKYGKTVAIDLFCAALTTVCELVLPLIVSAITDRATTDIRQPDHLLCAQAGWRVPGAAAH